MKITDSDRAKIDGWWESHVDPSVILSARSLVQPLRHKNRATEQLAEDNL